jgi:hypothetical protein
MGKMSRWIYAERSGFPLKQLYQTAEKLEQHETIREGQMRILWIGGSHPRHLYYINTIRE